MTRSITLIAGLGLASLALPSGAHAQAFVTGAQLTRACNGRTPAETFSCDGYIAGTLDAVRDSPEYKDKLCPPNGVKLSVMRGALGKFGQLHPDDAKGPGVALVAAFIKSNFPCPAK